MDYIKEQERKYDESIEFETKVLVKLKEEYACKSSSDSARFILIQAINRQKNIIAKLKSDRNGIPRYSNLFDIYTIIYGTPPVISYQDDSDLLVNQLKIDKRSLMEHQYRETKIYVDGYVIVYCRGYVDEMDIYQVTTLEAAKRVIKNLYIELKKAQIGEQLFEKGARIAVFYNGELLRHLFMNKDDVIYKEDLMSKISLRRMKQTRVVLISSLKVEE